LGWYYPPQGLEKSIYGILPPQGIKIIPLILPVAIMGLDLIKEVEVTENKDYVDIEGLDINTHKFYLLILDIKCVSSTEYCILMFVNDDNVEANYYSQYIWVRNTTISANRENSPKVLCLPGGASVSVHVFVHLDPDGHMRYNSVPSRDQPSNVQFVLRAGCSVNTFNNITKIRLSSTTSGGIGAGSKIRVFGYKA